MTILRFPLDRARPSSCGQMIVAEAEVVVMPVVRLERDDPVTQDLQRAIRAIERERHSLSGHEFMIGGHRGFSIIGDTFELPPE
jgi:hypothetical protein